MYKDVDHSSGPIDKRPLKSLEERLVKIFVFRVVATGKVFWRRRLVNYLHDNSDFQQGVVVVVVVNPLVLWTILLEMDTIVVDVSKRLFFSYDPETLPPSSEDPNPSCPLTS